MRSPVISHGAVSVDNQPTMHCLKVIWTDPHSSHRKHNMHTYVGWWPLRKIHCGHLSTNLTTYIHLTTYIPWHYHPSKHISAGIPHKSMGLHSRYYPGYRMGWGMDSSHIKVHRGRFLRNHIHVPTHCVCYIYICIYIYRSQLKAVYIHMYNVNTSNGLVSLQ